MTARIVCASATRRFASTTLRAISSKLDAAPPAGGVPTAGLAVPVTGVLVAGVGAGEGEGATEGGLEGAAGMDLFIFMAATLAAISARFWAMMASVERAGVADPLVDVGSLLSFFATDDSPFPSKARFLSLMVTTTGPKMTVSERTTAGVTCTPSLVLTSMWPLRLPVPRVQLGGVRFRSQLAPRQIQNVKRHKGRIPIPTGGSTRGTTLAFGDWGIRIKGMGVRFTAKQLMTAEEVIKRNIKVVKGAKVYLRVFPDIPVCIKGNETRMGKGKGTFEFWATRVPTGRVIFEIGGTPIREELAREALRQAADKLPTTFEFITRQSLPRLGNMVVQPSVSPASTTSTATAVHTL